MSSLLLRLKNAVHFVFLGHPYTGADAEISRGEGEGGEGQVLVRVPYV